MLPNLSVPMTPNEAARVRTRARLDDLPPELLALLMGMIESDDPCMEVTNLCMLNSQWADWCRDGWLYDVANYALGYYGAQKTWKAVVQHYTDAGRVSVATPMAYFKEACRARHGSMFPRARNSLAGVESHHPFYGARLLQQAPSLNIQTFQRVSTDLWNYNAIARVYISRWWPALQWVPKDYADYGALAKFAMQEHGMALQYVPAARADYGALARLAVQENGEALQFVKRERADYGAIAKLAVQQNGNALHWVPRDRADYYAIEHFCRD